MFITDNIPVSVLLAGMSDISLRSKRLIFCEITRFFGKFDSVNTHVGEQHPPEKNHARTSSFEANSNRLVRILERGK